MTKGVLVTFNSSVGLLAERRMEVFPRKGDRVSVNGRSLVVDEVDWDFRSVGDPQVTLWLIPR